MELQDRKTESLLNRAYDCFAFVGLVFLPFGLARLFQALGLVNFDDGSGGLGEWLTGGAMFWGMLLGLPLTVGMLVALVCGFVLTVRLRSHLVLVILAVISIVCGGGWLILLPTVWDGGPVPPIREYVMDVEAGIYLAASVLIPGWWFTVGRRRYRDAALRPE